MKMRRQRVSPRKLKVIATPAASSNATTGDIFSQRDATMKMAHDAAQITSAGKGHGMRGSAEPLTNRSGTIVESEVEREADAAPVLAGDGDRRGRFLHHDEVAAAHVAPIRLQQEWPLVACRSESRAVVEDATVAAVGRVPDEIAALRVAVL